MMGVAAYLADLMHGRVSRSINESSLALMEREELIQLQKKLLEEIADAKAKERVLEITLELLKIGMDEKQILQITEIKPNELKMLIFFDELRKTQA
ncbi:hypothetical protein [Brenneria corticis]|uniref:Uncharacterized protein n=1 Tax=Brenneria corticis TaxID=2173106 RepID=A0A2U1U6U8_9GAMM|nr:hypothetical protein [Brenneria sp. CFCC 11842]PWC17401.1 hypothetical protein DDT56_07740 [Brenneria sp. CFCC 11842]